MPEARSWSIVLALVAAAAVMAVGVVFGDAAGAGRMKYPPSRKVTGTDVLFGVKVPDPYRWLEDARNPEVKDWMGAQDRLTRGELGRLPGRDALRQRFHELYYLDSLGAPLHRGNRYFYYRTHADREKAVVYWRQGAAGPERVLLDPNTMSADGSTSLGVWVPSHDGQRVAYAIRKNNADEATLYVMEVASGRTSDVDVDVIEGAKYASPSWTPSGDGFYYTYLPTDPAIPAADRPGLAEVRFHELGTPATADRLVHQRTGDPKSFIGADLSRDGRWLVVTIAHGWTSTDVYYRDLSRPEPGWKPLVAGRDATYNVVPWQGRFYILTNEGAPRGRIFRAEAGRLEREAWKEIVPQPADAVIEDVQVLGGHLAVSCLQNAASRLELRTLEGSLVRPVSLPGIGASYIIGNPDEDEAFFSFQSFTRPPEIHRTSVATGQSSVWSAVKVPVDPAPYEVEQVFYPSRDGTRVSMFIVRRKSRPLDGSTPFLLTGYGGFNLSERPAFGAARYPWLEAGGAYAVPNLRGGGEYGEEWHRAGMGHKKQNVFDDFIAAAEYLVQKGYTRPERLVITGGSNGGLLVGAALTQRPELFRAVVCSVPLLDMVRYHLFGSGRTWTLEYGSAENESDFRALFAYSPYHHVTSAAYPSVLMLSADSDDRVDPMHARKMTALLQEASTSGRPVLLRIESHAGHGGADMVKQAVELSADQYAFLMNEVGLRYPPM